MTNEKIDFGLNADVFASYEALAALLLGLRDVEERRFVS